MIDTHCHIYLKHFVKDLQEVLDRATEAGVRRILMPAINYGSLKQMDRLSHEQIDFFKMAGIHPTEVNEGVSTTEEELFEHCRVPEIIAVGETGLDYYWSDEYRKEQRSSLELHCRVAKAVEKPIVLHNRDSSGDLLDIIEKEQDGTLAGVWHCFNGTVEEGERAIDLGLFLGIGGVLTFRNAGVDRSVGRLPLEKMILETDAPYLSPEPKRGKRNEPAFIRYTAEKLSEVAATSFEEVVEVTTANAENLFTLNG